MENLFHEFGFIVEHVEIKPGMIQFAFKPFNTILNPLDHDLHNEFEYDELKRGFRNFLEVVVIESKRCWLIIEGSARIATGCKAMTHYIPTIDSRYIQRITSEIVEIR